MDKAKPFDEKLYIEHDERAKKVAIKTAMAFGRVDYVGRHASKFGPDLICYKDTFPTCFLEVEVKKVWSGAEFPWDAVHIPFRKKKFVVDYLPTWFNVMNKEYTHGIMVNGKDVLQSPIVVIDNKYQKQEKFFRVPIDKTQLVRLQRL